ncbi:uncharacterized protein LOC133892289 [Phragmites australis]|uniref:uncharacterized protein LOC133892289 n=1 Tax=Phragmites australis TaxID=29695 RepID=UPI002D7653EF|nr:uncharacterized protein LOC133892289 [Phragmites australis]
MAGLLTRMTEWLIRAMVLSSFVAHVVLFLFADIRRHRAFDWRTLLLWLAYQMSDSIVNYALSHLSLGSTSHEQQLIAFWAALLLLYLGGTDNITAYSLEDSKLWKRKALDVFFKVGGSIYVLYKHVYIGGGGTLIPASAIMFAVGIAKYVEKVLALRGGDLSSIQSTRKRQPGATRRQKLNDEQALLVAHDLFDICKGAFADFWVVNDAREPSRTIFSSESLTLKDKCKVVEMELSLMYDTLYTKASVIYTWRGYGVRVASPVATAAAILLFWLYSKDGHRLADVVITYILLVFTFLLDVRWLLGALASTWTYAFLTDRPGPLHHKLVCSGRWQRLRRAVMPMDPRWLLLYRLPSSSYRRWSGTIGQYNLLRECTHGNTRSGFFSRQLKKFASDDIWKEYQYSRGFEVPEQELVFERVWELLMTPSRKEKEEEEKKKEAKPEALVLGHEDRRLLDHALDFGPELQELVLIWHIATDVFFLHIDEEAASSPDGKVIKTLSDYMVFLVAVRQEMLPGLKLHSLYTETRVALETIWKVNAKKSSSCRPRTSPRGRAREKKLASALQCMEGKLVDSNKSCLYKKSIILSDGTYCAELLLGRLEPSDWKTNPTKEKSLKLLQFFFSGPWWEEYWKHVELQSNMPRLLKFILKVWVRMLIFGSVRCSRDSHARQLSRGGDLTTIVWMLAVHAGHCRTDRNA